MWERITAGLASLGDQAVAGDSRESLPSDQAMDEQQLVEYEGMLVAASAAQRRRYTCSHSAVQMMLSQSWPFSSPKSWYRYLLHHLGKAGADTCNRRAVIDDGVQVLLVLDTESCQAGETERRGVYVAAHGGGGHAGAGGGPPAAHHRAVQAPL